MLEPKQLKAYQNTTPECNVKGGLVGQNGEMYNILDFDVNKYVTVDRIARALSRTNRYVGNSKMTTAQHCVRGCEALILIGHPDLAYDFLFHDCAESLIGDFSSPIKKLIIDFIGPIEKELESRLSKRFKFTYPFHPLVDLIDKNSAQDEIIMIKEGYKFDYWDEEKAFSQFIIMYTRLNDYRTYQTKELFGAQKPQQAIPSIQEK